MGVRGWGGMGMTLARSDISLTFRALSFTIPCSHYANEKPTV